MIISSSTKINSSPINKRKEIYNKRDKSWMERHDEFTNAIISSASKMGYSDGIFWAICHAWSEDSAHYRGLEIGRRNYTRVHRQLGKFNR